METTSKIIKVSAVLVMIVISLFVYFFFIKNDKVIKKIGTENQKSIQPLSSSIPEKKIVPNDKTEKSAEESSIKAVQMDLNDSDYMVRNDLKNVSSHSEINELLKIDRLIRRFVASVENISNGESPLKNLGFIDLSEKFKTKVEGNRIFLDSQSYRRYNKITDIFLSLNEIRLIELYNKYKLLISDAYKDLGYPKGDFKETFINAINILLGTPTIKGKIYLKPKIITFEFSDPKLESLNNAQKQFLRMGPSNIKKVKIKLALIKDLLKN